MSPAKTEARPDVLIGAYVPAGLADRFKDFARQSDGSASACLRRLMKEAIGDTGGGAGASSWYLGFTNRLTIRFKETEMLAVREAAKARGSNVTQWVRSLVLVFLTRRPQWSPAELKALQEIARDVRPIGNNINQVARALHTAIKNGRYPPHQGARAAKAAYDVSRNLRRLTAVITGDYDYWGVPEDARPKPWHGAKKAGRARRKVAKRLDKLKPRRGRAYDP